MTARPDERAPATRTRLRTELWWLLAIVCYALLGAAAGTLGILWCVCKASGGC